MRDHSTDQLQNKINELFRTSGLTMEEFYFWLTLQDGASADHYTSETRGTKYYSMHLIGSRSKWKSICSHYVNIYGYEDQQVWGVKN